MQTVYISLGSNMGNKKAYLDMALHNLGLHPDIEVVTVSDYIKTKPVNMAFTGSFLNAVARLDTCLSPEKLLNTIHSVETQCGRGLKASRRFLPRPVDIDILFFSDLEINTSRLTIPHPRMKDRDFVLEPLKQIAPQMLERLEQLQPA